MKLRTILPSECPYSCVYCYKEGVFTKRNGQLDADDFKFLISTAGKSGFDEFKATGGEPTNYAGLLELIKKAKDSNYSDIRMTTIGLKLSDMNYCNKLKDSGLDGVTISVNSFNPITYKKMTNSKAGDFERMRTGLENAVNVFGHSVTLNTVLTQWNMGEIPELIDYASKRGLGVKILEMLDEEKIAPINSYVHVNEFKQKNKIKNGKMINPTRELVRIGGARVYFVNSCCARKECGKCRKGYDVVRATSDGKLKTCISNELNEKNIYNEIKNRDESAVIKVLEEVTKKFA